MTTHDAGSPAQTDAKRLRFDRYVLDLHGGSLLLDGNEIALRPKTFAVLSYLIENAGRLVSKDELFGAVWPNLAITDDVLVQSIGELRRALGDDGSRLIRTMPRRGYRFESDVSVVAPADQSSAGTASAASRDDAQPTASDTRAAGPLARLARAVGGRRIGLAASFGLAVLVAVGVLWAGIATTWEFGHLPGRADRSAANSLEIDARPAIAVLPLVNQGNEAAREYFADGLTQDIINALGRFSELTVMSWNAVLPYKSRPASPAEIARGLGVRYQVEGSVLQTGDRVRVTAQLVSSDGGVLWSGRFDEPLADLFALQEKITTQIAGALAIRVAQVEQRRVVAKPTESLEAYDYVLRARPALQRPERADIAQARILLRRAIEIDPSYAAAYAALADTYQITTVMGWTESPAASLSRAEEMANKALSLDESDLRAHIVLGRIHIFHQQYEPAKAELDRAIAINPSDAHALAGRGNILMWSGETDAAIETLELAQRIDPDLNVIDRNALSLAYYLKRRYDAAIEQAELNLRRTESANFSRVVLASAYAQANQTGNAARVVTAIHRLDPTFDPQDFGSKFLKPADLAHLRDGFHKAGLDGTPSGVQPRTTDR
jgi:TolB-like protein/DNA-binding winged helix-turn-helix (wHTH) protein/cytochrome c-type biogenesis protein CcmH/NrfG